MKLIGKGKYERRFVEEGISEQEQAIFYLKKFTVEEMSIIDDHTYVPDENGVITYRGGAAFKWKLRLGLIDWKNVKDENGNEVKCTEENKNLLGIDVTMWLVSQMDELNGLRRLMTDQERKNFSSLLKS